MTTAEEDVVSNLQFLISWANTFIVCEVNEKQVVYVAELRQHIYTTRTSFTQ